MPLSISQLTAKIGAGFRQYPRHAGVLVPRALAGLTPGHLPDNDRMSTLDQTARLRLGRAVVQQVAKRWRTLPGELLATPLAAPAIVVGVWSIEHRTRNVVERLVPFADGESAWTVARYLQVPKLGVRCLVDLLAAHDESLRHATVADSRPALLDRPRLEALRHRLAVKLPLTSSDLLAIVPELLRAEARSPLRALARAFEEAGLTPPFRLMRRGGQEIAVAPGGSGIAVALGENASRQVTAWGLARVDEVATRARALTSSPVSTVVARRLLVALPRLRWLDAERQWFSLAGERSPLRKSIEKVFATVRLADLDDLVCALSKNHPAARQAPSAVFARYLSEIADCEIAGPLVHARAPVPAAAPGPAEAALVEHLVARGGEATVAQLRRLLADVAPDRRSFERLIGRSPLVVQAAGRRIRFIGRGVLSPPWTGARGAVAAQARRQTG